MPTDPDRPNKPRRRRVWVITLIALMAIAVVVTWRATSLSGLPDIGDPFDVASYADVKIPDNQNSFTYYRQAAAKVKADKAGYTLDWATASEAEKAWLESNREALGLWKQGTDRPDSYYNNPRAASIATKVDVATSLRIFSRMALLESTRLMAVGDYAGAYDLLKADLRASRHLGRRGGFLERLVGMAIHRAAANAITRWATRPEVDAVLLRKALDDVIAIDAMTPPDSDGIKYEHLSMINSMDDLSMMMSATVTPGPQPSPRLQSIGLILRREPERSRRVLRLSTANWLAFCDLPPARQPQSVATKLALAKDDRMRPMLEQIYVTDAASPPLSRVIPPEELADWWYSTLYLRLSLPAFGAVKTATARERTAQAALVLSIANELYKRDHGKYPESTDELVGPYLKALPEPGYKPPG